MWPITPIDRAADALEVSKPERSSRVGPDGHEQPPRRRRRRGRKRHEFEDELEWDTFERATDEGKKR